MARHSITGHADRHKRTVISSACVGGRGGVVKPYVHEVEAVHIDPGRIAVLEATVKRLEAGLLGQLENRRQDVGG